jgi:hypothetical protein
LEKPYHSKYNPIERVWGILEKSWNGSILDEVKTALNFAENMTWKGKHPVVVKLITQTYETGVKLTNKAMSAVEQQELILLCQIGDIILLGVIFSCSCRNFSNAS